MALDQLAGVLSKHEGMREELSPAGDVQTFIIIGTERIRLRIKAKRLYTRINYETFLVGSSLLGDNHIFQDKWEFDLGTYEGTAATSGALKVVGY